MYLDNPRAAERDNQNSLRKYPFADAAACGNGACVIPPGAIIDAQLYVPGRTAGRVWLSVIDNLGLLHFSDAHGEFAVTAQPIQPLAAVPITFTGDGFPLPGGVVVCGREQDVAALLRAGRQTFTADQAELTPASVTFTGARGVTGFKLDDGHVAWGAVKIRGANGCDVATYVKDGNKYLRISAVGQAVTDTIVTGFITKVIATSDNSNFTVASLMADDAPVVPNRCVFITPNGANYVSGYAVDKTVEVPVPYDQEDACAAVKKTRGTLPSGSATVPPDCGKDICHETPAETCTLHLRVDGTEVGTVTVLEGDSLGRVTPPTISGSRFTGYYRSVTDEHGVTSLVPYYRADGTGVGTCRDRGEVVLDARWMPASSTATATFDGYGTLHLLAPDATMPAYANPLRISGGPGIVPQIRTMTTDELAAGGSDALGELILHPATAAGEVHLSLRGLQKAFDS